MCAKLNRRRSIGCKLSCLYLPPNTGRARTQARTCARTEHRGQRRASSSSITPANRHIPTALTCALTHAAHAARCPQPRYSHAVLASCAGHELCVPWCLSRRPTLPRIRTRAVSACDAPEPVRHGRTVVLPCRQWSEPSTPPSSRLSLRSSAPSARSCARYLTTPSGAYGHAQPSPSAIRAPYCFRPR